MQLISLLPKLSEQLAKNLLAYMIPSIFMSLRHLPLTVSGNWIESNWPSWDLPYKWSSLLLLHRWKLDDQWAQNRYF